MTLPEGMRDPADRQPAECAHCHQIDSHPRHHTGHTVDGQVVVLSKHLDCCHASGCHDGSCGEILARSGNAHGLALAQHIVDHGAAQGQIHIGADGQPATRLSFAAAEG